METQTISLSPAERVRFERAFSSLPYSGICHFRTVLTVDDVLFNLTALRQVLGGVVERHEIEEKELDRFRSWMGTAREVLEAVKQA